MKLRLWDGKQIEAKKEKVRSRKMGINIKYFKARFRG